MSGFGRMETLSQLLSWFLRKPNGVLSFIIIIIEPTGAILKVRLLTYFSKRCQYV